MAEQSSIVFIPDGALVGVEENAKRMSQAKTLREADEVYLQWVYTQRGNLSSVQFNLLVDEALTVVTEHKNEF